MIIVKDVGIVRVKLNRAKKRRTKVKNIMLLLIKSGNIVPVRYMLEYNELQLEIRKKEHEVRKGGHDRKDKNGGGFGYYVGKAESRAKSRETACSG